jgi:hypothetical protein
LSKLEPDVALFQDFGPLPESIVELTRAYIGASRGNVSTTRRAGRVGRVRVGYSEIDEMLSKLALLPSDDKEAWVDGLSVYSTRDIKLLSASSSKSSKRFRKVMVQTGRPNDGGGLVIYNVGLGDRYEPGRTHPKQKGAIIQSLCDDIIDERSKKGAIMIMVIGDFGKNITALSDNLRTCGMIMLNDDTPTTLDGGVSDLCWVSIELYRASYIRPVHNRGKIVIPLIDVCPHHFPVCVDIVWHSENDDDALAMLSVSRSLLESCLLHTPGVDRIGGIHVRENFSFDGRISRKGNSYKKKNFGKSSSFVMFTNFVPTQRVRTLSIGDTAGAGLFPALVEGVLSSYGVFVEAVNGWWVLDVAGRKHVWGYMINVPEKVCDNMAPLYVHYCKEYIPIDYIEYSRWLALGPENSSKNSSKSSVILLPKVPSYRHFVNNTSDALCDLIRVPSSGGGGSVLRFDVNASNDRYVGIMEGIYSSATAFKTLDCLKKTPRVWTRFTELNIALAVGRLDAVQSRETVAFSDFPLLWEPIFTYYNEVLTVARKNLKRLKNNAEDDDVLPPLIMFRSQNPSSGFLTTKSFGDLVEGDIVETNTFTFTTYSSHTQSIVLSKSYDMEVVYVVPTSLIPELFILSRASQSMGKINNLPCLFLREEIMIPPFALHRVLRVCNGYVETPKGTSTNMVHSGTGDAVVEKIRMYWSDKTTAEESSRFLRRFVVVEILGFSKNRISEFDRVYGTDFTTLYKSRTLI